MICRVSIDELEHDRKTIWLDDTDIKNLSSNESLLIEIYREGIPIKTAAVLAQTIQDPNNAQLLYSVMADIEHYLALTGDYDEWPHS